MDTVAETWRRVWGTVNFPPTKMTFFSEKISILAAKISDDLFLVIDQVFRIFPLFLLFSYFCAHPTTLLLKILGGRMHGSPSPPQTLGDRPPVPLGFRPCMASPPLTSIAA